jgi:antitoxin component of MazEF toxin-antitoxin module
VTTSTIGKWGNSLGVRIPQELLKSAHLELGAKVEIHFLPDQGILLKPSVQTMRKTNRELRKLLLSMRGKNKPELSQGILIDDSVGDEMD